MSTQAEFDAEFKAWRQQHGLTGVQTGAEVDRFLADRREALAEKAQVQRDVNRWPRIHPECSIQVEPNKSLFTKWLVVHDLPATMDNLEEAFAHLKQTGGLELIEIPDPNKPETRVGAWRNGRFYPDPGYNQPETVTYAQHADTPATVGQSDPGKSAAGEPTIRKSVRNMSAQEYLDYINSSRTFQRKMDESK